MKLSEGRKMFLTVLTFFLINTAAFVIFDDIDRNKLNLLDEPAERRLLLFAIFLLFVMGSSSTAMQN